MAVITSTDNYSTLLGNAIAELQSNTNISQLTPGAKARSILEIMSREVANAELLFSSNLVQAYVTNASGQNLDLIGELVGLARFRSSRAEVAAASQVQKFYVSTGGTFGSINNGSSFVIPANTRIITNTQDGSEPISYYLVESCTCSAAATVAYATIKSNSFGSLATVGSNQLVIHDFEGYTDFRNETLQTTNVEPIMIGSEEETDTNFRYRIINQTLASEAANTTSIRLAALVVPGVADITIDEFALGIGTAIVYVKSVIPQTSETLIATVQRAVDRARATGAFISVRGPELIGVEMDAKIYLYKRIPQDEQDELTSSIEMAVVNYLNGLDIGQSLEMDRIYNVIMGTDSNIRRVGDLGTPFDSVYIYRESVSGDGNRVPEKLLSDFVVRTYARMVAEFSISEPIRVTIG